MVCRLLSRNQLKHPARPRRGRFFSPYHSAAGSISPECVAAWIWNGRQNSTGMRGGVVLKQPAGFG